MNGFTSEPVFIRVDIVDQGKNYKWINSSEKTLINSIRS